MAPNIQWVPPLQCAPPHPAVDGEKIGRLMDQFRRRGWDPEAPALVGYAIPPRTMRNRTVVVDDPTITITVQLLSGSHRWSAACMTPIGLIPVRVHPYPVVAAAWGDIGRWAEVMRELPAGPDPRS